MALLKLCRCGSKIPMNIKMCTECQSKVNERHKDYDKSVRYSKSNIKYNKFYHSVEWHKVREVAIVRDYGLCQDCLINNKTTTYDTVHHIEPIKLNWDRRLDIKNLICLCESCHQKRHNTYTTRGY